MNIKEVPHALCGHTSPLKHCRKYKAKCTECNSFWDMDALSANIEYDPSYPELRSHYSPAVGANKIKTLQGWLKTTGINLTPVTVCEVGFGGGYCLKYLQDMSLKTYGIETIQQNIDHAATIGVKKECLFLADHLPEELPSKVDLWIFQDSYEHLTSPGAFVSWLSHNSSAGAYLLIVSPEASSLSEKILGRYWPHKLNDHTFHWSRKGLIDFFSQRGFIIERFFTPKKDISLMTVAAHLVHKAKISEKILDWLNGSSLKYVSFRFNIGEMGLLIRRRA